MKSRCVFILQISKGINVGGFGDSLFFKGCNRKIMNYYFYLPLFFILKSIMITPEITPTL
jgi:hypothetical protein